jgi:hypothetical protein
MSTLTYRLHEMKLIEDGSDMIVRYEMMDSSGRWHNHDARIDKKQLRYLLRYMAKKVDALSISDAELDRWAEWNYLGKGLCPLLSSPAPRNGVLAIAAHPTNCVILRS